MKYLWNVHNNYWLQIDTDIMHIPLMFDELFMSGAEFACYNEREIIVMYVV